MCGAIFKYEFVANLPVSLSVKNCENQLGFGEGMGKSLVSCFLVENPNKENSLQEDSYSPQY